jgi:HSP20 family protein
MANRSNPFKDIEELFDRMGRGFEAGDLSVHDVAVDVSETDEEVVVTADLPGFEKSDIEVTVDDDGLTITAEREETTAEDDARYHRRERTRSEVQRRLSLPADVEETEASASYHNGVLTVVLPKRETTEDEGYDIDVQ